MTRVVRARAAVRFLGDTRWRLHYCERCDHRFPTVQRVPQEADYLAGDDAMADIILASEKTSNRKEVDAA